MMRMFSRKQLVVVVRIARAPGKTTGQINKDRMKLMFDFLKNCKSVVLVNNLYFLPPGFLIPVKGRDLF